MIEEISLKALEHSLILIPTLVKSLRDNDSIVATKSIVSGTNVFRRVLYELALQVILVSFEYISL